ncbi:vacuolar protein sorting-associated protein 4A-like [Littorina saxatilis]
MLTNIARCDVILQQLRHSQHDPAHKRALTSLLGSLTADRKILTRKIQQLSGAIPTKEAASKGDGETQQDDSKMKEKRGRQLSIEETILRHSDVTLRDVVGLCDAKQALQEAVVMPLVFPHLFLGGRKPWRRVLLYGPPGTGKSRLAQAIASQIQSTFYCVSSADLVSSWVGESEKLIKELFTHATNQGGRSVIFIDEIDSICRQRCSREDEHTRRIKTELLKQMEGADNSSSLERLFLMCATNCPWELDSAFLRRFQKRIFIPLPDRESRIQLMKMHSQTTPVELSGQDWERLADSTEGYSGSDLATLTLGALFQPIRDMQQAQHWRQLTDGGFTPCSLDQQGAFVATLSDLPPDKVTPRDVSVSDFIKSIATHRRTVSAEELAKFHHFTHSFGDSG